MHAVRAGLSDPGVRLSIPAQGLAGLCPPGNDTGAELSHFAPRQSADTSEHAERCWAMVLTEWLQRRKRLEMMVSAVLVCGGCSNSDHGPSGPGGSGCARTSSCEGEIVVKIDVNQCPALDFLWVAPSRVTVGSSAHFGATLSDPDGDFVDQFWTVTGGLLTAEAGSGIVDTFTCLLPGTETLTLWYFDSRGCAKNQGTDLDCLAAPDDAGG